MKLRRWGAAAAFFAGLTVVGGAQAVDVTLYGLAQGGTITAGDKLFDNWTILGAESIDPAAIAVIPLNDGGLDPGPGLRFEFMGDAGRVDAGGADKSLQFIYHIKVLGAGLLIKDNSLKGAVSEFVEELPAPGDPDEATWEYRVSVRENVGTTAGENDLGFKEILKGIRSDPSEQKQIEELTDSLDFLEYRTEIWVQKTISISFTYAEPGGPGSPDGWVRLDGFEQRYSQVVPLPAAVWLLGSGLGLLVLGFSRRRAH